MAITGNGAASKEQVSAMLQRILKIPDSRMADKLDATDALGAALCHFYETSKPVRHQVTSHSWKDFINKIPTASSDAAGIGFLYKRMPPSVVAPIGDRYCRSLFSSSSMRVMDISTLPEASSSRAVPFLPERAHLVTFQGFEARRIQVLYWGMSYVSTSCCRI